MHRLYFKLSILISIVLTLQPFTMAFGQSTGYQEILSIGRGNLRALAWRPDGNILAVGGSQGIWLYDENLQNISNFRGRALSALSWKPDGMQIASLSDDGIVQIQNATNGQVSLQLAIPNSKITSVAWSPNGNLIATGSLDKSVRLWNPLTGQQTSTLSGHTGNIRNVAWSPNSTRLASASNDGTIRVWDIQTGQQIAILQEGTRQSVATVVWSTNNQQIASSKGNKIDLWNVSNFELTTQLTISSEEIKAGVSLSLSPDGAYLASGGVQNIAPIWNLATRQVQTTLSNHAYDVTLVSWSFKGIVATVDDDQILRTWNPSTGQLLTKSQEHNENIGSLAWKPDGQLLAGSEALSDFANLRVWNLTTGKLTEIAEKTTFGINSAGNYAISWAPDGRSLAGAARGNSVVIWDSTTYRILRQLTNHSSDVDAIAWRSDSISLACGSDNEVKIWNATTGQLQKTLKLDSSDNAPSVRVTGIAWSPTGQQIAIVTEDGIIRVFSSTTYALIFSQKIHYTEGGGGRYFIKWTSNGTQLISNGEVLDATTGISQRSIPNVSYVSDIKPDNTVIATTPLDSASNIVLISVTDGTVITTLSGNWGTVINLAWSSDGTKLASTNSDGTIRIFSVSNNATSTPPPPSTLKLQYYSDPGVSGNVVDGVMPDFNIVNTGSTAVPLSELKIRYYFTRDTTDPNVTLRYVCSYTDLPGGCGGSSVVRGVGVKMATPFTGADSYLELSFTGGTLAANSQTNEILSYMNKSDWSNYTQNNDYSFDGTRGEVFSDWNKVTLYRNGVLIWGIEPH